MRLKSNMVQQVIAAAALMGHQATTNHRGWGKSCSAKPQVDYKAIINEYALIQQKKSRLSKSKRDRVVATYMRLKANPELLEQG